MIVRRHGHHSPHTLTVLSGEFTCGDELCGVGTHIELPAGLEDLRAVFSAGSAQAD